MKPFKVAPGVFSKGRWYYLVVAIGQKLETPYLFLKQDGQPMTYSAVANAWQDGLRRSKVLPFMFRDIRARALTDKDKRDGRASARAMSTHTTETQTADYLRSKTHPQTKATA